jgi:ribonuclease P protein component
MLPPANRLKKERDIKQVLASKNSHRSAMLACKAAPNGLAVSRFCFVVSRRVSSKAVVRNKVKRRLRAAVSALLSRVKPGWDCVVIADPRVPSSNFQDLAAALEKLFLAAKIV